mgnify:CR=1 FL=1
MKSRIILTVATALILSHCNNLGLLDKLENPGGGSKNGNYATNNYIFVSSWLVDGSINPSPYVECAGMTGVQRADCACTKAAEFNNRLKYAGQKFYAWLSINSTPGPQVDAICRLTGQATACTVPTVAQPWFNTQGQTVANNLNDFISSTFAAAVRYSETGADIAPDLVWTSTGSAGTALNTTSSDCSGWGSTAPSTGGVGSRISTGAAWTNSSSSACSTSQRIYCVAQP